MRKSEDPAGDGPAQTLPEGRYGDDGTGTSLAASRFVATVLGILVIALIVAGGYFVYTLLSEDDISISETGFDVVDDHTVTMQIDVTRDDPQTPVYCIIRAREASGAEVGRREVYIPASEHRTVRTEAPISTINRAVDVDAYGCGADVPSYLQEY